MDTEYTKGFKAGIAFQQERIIKLLIDKAIEWRTNDLHQQGDYIDFTIALIKGEKDEDACEPSDSPCVNGWSCRKHEMTIEQMTNFIALIKGEK